MVSLGLAAPDFTAPSTTGGSLELSSLKGNPVVLYFFHKAFTPL